MRRRRSISGELPTGYGMGAGGSSDVRKSRPRGAARHLAKDDERVRIARERLFGSWEMNWIAYNFAHDVSLPRIRSQTLGYFIIRRARPLMARSTASIRDFPSTRSRCARSLVRRDAMLTAGRPASSDSSRSPDRRRRAAYDAIETDTARLCAALGCPHPYLRWTSVTGQPVGLVF